MTAKTENEQDLELIEISLQQAKDRMRVKHALDLLTANKQFEEIILNGYFKQEASRLVLLKAEPAMQDDASQKQIDNLIIGIGCLRMYFRTITKFGEDAEKAIAADEETREEILAEDS